MKYALMTYTMARQVPDGRPDMAQLCQLARDLDLDGMDQVTLYHYTAAEIRRIADDHGIRIVCYTFFADFNFPDSAARRPGLEEFRKGIDAAEALGAPAIMLPITGKPGTTRDQSRRQVLAGLREALPIARAAGIKISVEHFPNPLSPFIVSDDINQGAQTLPELYATFDSGNVLTGGEDPVAGFLNNKDRIIHAHFKDWIHPANPELGFVGLDEKRYAPALIGEGLIDYPKLLRTMIHADYQGYIDIEYEGNDYSADQATRRALAYLRSIEQTLKNNTRSFCRMQKVKQIFF